MYVVIVLILFVLCGWTNPLHAADRLSDEPEYPPNSTVPFKAADSYEHALQLWKTPEDIHAWIAANFKYDTGRALRLSETQRSKNEEISILTPAQFFATQTGVCVDLARFGVETLRRIDPKSDPKYVMIEFDPIHIAGNTLRLHWLVSFRRDGKIFFFSDSKRPGHMAGPYTDALEFIQEYARYRGRMVVTFRELDSYQKQRRTKSMKKQAPKAP
jgi:hypothetical protein